ncbi:alpha/beta fold hydrolase [Leisingera sp. HS039]|uniref:alpha/beta fold hydrolase n=1 Tax=unclassified Leisingera TaxID=2614906 RepID=UPI0010714198|nr:MULTISPECIES: alpha/beta fold hydrolase [unclassified Leisingera]MBQ4823540.1 alpha/beta fold hydrolase [Leisingera sp. HS039]QBR37163.1 alpha/beta fold hydrolase [Leisingera sp. NJS201]
MTVDLQTSEPASQQSASGHDPHLIAVAAEETFEKTWPYPARYSSASGHPMHYVDEGSGPETLLLLHGEPTWSYLYRAQIAEWSRDARVIALDHMGFGKSATPQDRSYWLQDHIDNTERFVLEQDLRDVTLVMHDFGGPVGMGLAIRHPDRIKRIVSVNGPTPLGQPDLLNRLIANAGAAPWFQWILQAEENGTLEAVLGHLDFNILSTLKLNGFVRNELITETWLNAYRAPFPAPEFAAGAIGWAKGFATGQHAFEEPSDAVKAVLARKPAIAIWGEADSTLQAEQFLPLFRQAFPRGQIKTLPETGHYSPEDAPQLVSGLVSEFIAAS